MTDLQLRQADSAADIAACYPVMAQLRPHISSADELVTRVLRQREAGYRLLAAWHGAVPVGLAGWRVEENLIYGRFVYVDDLVTAEAERGKRIGAMLLDAVAAEAARLGCVQFVLDTALDNVLAHRFYYRQGLLARGLRFRRPVAVT